MDCKINETFSDANDPKYHRERYCKLNCNYKCLSSKHNVLLPGIHETLTGEKVYVDKCIISE